MGQETRGLGTICDLALRLPPSTPEMSIGNYQSRAVNRQCEDELCLLLIRSEVSPPLREQALGLLASPLRWPLVIELRILHLPYR